jgi:hypothetical protein
MSQCTTEFLFDGHQDARHKSKCCEPQRNDGLEGFFTQGNLAHFEEGVRGEPGDE